MSELKPPAWMKFSGWTGHDIDKPKRQWVGFPAKAKGSHSCVMYTEGENCAFGDGLTRCGPDKLRDLADLIEFFYVAEDDDA